MWIGSIVEHLKMVAKNEQSCISQSGTDNCLDSTLTESFVVSLKTEWIHPQHLAIWFVCHLAQRHIFLQKICCIIQSR